MHAANVTVQNTKLGMPVPQLPVADVAAAQVYYRERLGFEIAWIDPTHSMGAVSRDGIAIFFSRTTGTIVPNMHWIFAEAIDETYEAFKKSGAEIVEAIENKPWNMRQFAIRDLDGHIFYIHHDL